MRSAAASCGTPVQTGSVLATDDVDELARELNERVIRRLFAATIDLIDLAVTLNDPIRIRQLIGCVEHIDTAITQIRNAAFGTSANPRLSVAGPPT